MAYRLGFTQLGRLAGAYRHAFGEAPSATLARRHRGDAPLLWTVGANLGLCAA